MVERYNMVKPSNYMDLNEGFPRTSPWNLEVLVVIHLLLRDLHALLARRSDPLTLRKSQFDRTCGIKTPEICRLFNRPPWTGSRVPCHAMALLEGDGIFVVSSFDILGHPAVGAISTNHHVHLGAAGASPYLTIFAPCGIPAKLDGT